MFQKKRHPLYFCHYTVKCWPILIIFCVIVAEEICNKSKHVYLPHLLTVLIPYLVKIMIHLPVFTFVSFWFKKRHPFYFCDYTIKCRPILTIFGIFVKGWRFFDTQCVMKNLRATCRRANQTLILYSAFYVRRLKDRKRNKSNINSKKWNNKWKLQK